MTIEIKKRASKEFAEDTVNAAGQYKQFMKKPESERGVKRFLRSFACAATVFFNGRSAPVDSRQPLQLVRNRRLRKEKHGLSASLACRFRVDVL